MDIEYLLFLQNIREATGGVFNSFFSYITLFGEEFISLIFISAIYWCINKKLGSLMACCCGISINLNQLLKDIFCVYRPWVRDVRVEPVAGAKSTATGYSFPSGHTSYAVGVYGSLGFFCRKNYKLISIFSSVLIFLVMLSRNWLGVHAPQDVLVAFVQSVILVFLVNSVLNVLDKKPNLDILVLIFEVALIVFLLCYVSFKSFQPVYVDGNLLVDPDKIIVDMFRNTGLGLGFFLGWFCERRLIKFEVDGDWYKKVIRFVVGAFVVLNLNFTVSNIFIKLFGSHWGEFAAKFLLSFFIMAIYPLIFSKFESRKLNSNNSKC